MGVRLISQISKLVDPTVLVGVTCRFGSEVPRNGRVSRSYTEVCVCVCVQAPVGVQALRKGHGKIIKRMWSVVTLDTFLLQTPGVLALGNLASLLSALC